MVARERQAAAKADVIIAALDRVPDDALEDVMRELARALASCARQHRYVLVALLNRLWPIRELKADDAATCEGPDAGPLE